MDDGVTGERAKRVLIVDTQPIFRLGLAALLASAYPDWHVVESDVLDDYRIPLSRGWFDLLLIGGGILGQATMDGPAIHGGINLWVDIIAIIEPGDTIGGLGCRAAGAHATISRADPPTHLLTTIEVLSIQESSVEPEDPATKPVQEIPEPPLAETPELLNLTNRQFDVLRLLATGQSNKVIARDLGLSVSTVKVHLNTVFKALGARNRVEAVVRARPFQDRMAQSGP